MQGLKYSTYSVIRGGRQLMVPWNKEGAWNVFLFTSFELRILRNEVGFRNNIVPFSSTSYLSLFTKRTKLSFIETDLRPRKLHFVKAFNWMFVSLQVCGRGNGRGRVLRGSRGPRSSWDGLRGGRQRSPIGCRVRLLNNETNCTACDTRIVTIRCQTRNACFNVCLIHAQAVHVFSVINIGLIK